MPRRRNRGAAPAGVELIDTLRGHGKAVGEVAWSPDGSLLVTTSADATVRVWDGASHRHLHTITAHKEGLRAAAFDPHGQVLATGSEDGIVKLWQVGSWKLLKTLDFSDALKACNSLAFSPHQDVLAYGGDRSAALIDIASEEIRHRLQEKADHRRSYQAAFDPAGVMVAAAAGDLVGLWAASDGQNLAMLAGHTMEVMAVAMAPDGRLLASGSSDTTIKIWDPHSRNLVRTL